MGPKGSRDFGSFHIKPKAHAEEEEVPEDEWRKSRLPEYTAEDDPDLSRPKSQKGKAPRRPRQSLEDPKGDSKPNGPAIGAW